MEHFARTPQDMGHAIRQMRKARGMTQQQLAVRSGLWQETISKIETSQSTATLEALFDLCAALDLELVLTERSKGSTAAFEELF